ncbi:MAG TPA: hypothetical protein VFI25_00165 [Planctomycetota bacterium]|jgi:dienelactone hydrolase|nr:hypothetical protein [Planctomycetota bacterium]
MLRRALVLWIALSPTALAQRGLLAGFRDLAFPNPTGTGSATLAARVHYPATQVGLNAPLLPPGPGGYPVVVFLHGLGGLGSSYPDLGNVWASEGYVAAMLNTAQFQPDLERDDGIALFPVLSAANQNPASFLHAALDLQRAGLAGHSMGGGNVVRVLASNPGYAAGFCFAPWQGPTGSWPQTSGPQVPTPLAIVRGTGDIVLPLALSSIPFYALATAYTGVKTLYVLDGNCDHINVALVPPSATSTDLAVFGRTSSVSVGWFDRWLKGIPEGLEEVVGPAALSEPMLSSHSVEVERPDLWNVGTLRVSQTTTLHALAQPGPAAIAVATSSVSLPTPFGTLVLDPATLFPLVQGPVDADQLLSLAVPVPADGALVGVQVFLQGIGLDRDALLRLTPPLDRTIGP